MKLRKGDEVIITAGKDKEKRGKIEKVFPKTGKILVPGVNIYKRHLKAQGPKRPGGIIDIVRPLPVANVALICSRCGKTTRVGFKIESGVKKRICRKCQEVI